MKIYTDGDYESVLRLKNKPNDPESLLKECNPEIFLMDFFPCDQYTIKKYHQDYFESEDNTSQSDTQSYSDLDSNSDEKSDQSQFMVRVFGLIELPSSEGGLKYYSVSMDLMNFSPYFFIKIPEHWGDYDLEGLVNMLLEMGEAESWRYKKSITDRKIIKRKPLYYFTGNDKFKYAQLTFNSMGAFKFYHRLLEKPVNGVKYERMESNIDPFLRLIHIKDLTPSGWIKIPQEVLRQPQTYPSVPTSDCQIHLRFDYDKVIPLNNKTVIPPLIYASFDIEANSSHGDFPIAKKEYQKLAQDIMTEFLKQAPKYLSERQMTHVDIRPMILKWLDLAFHPYYFNPNISQLKTQYKTVPNAKQKLLIIEVLKVLGPKFGDLQRTFREKQEYEKLSHQEKEIIDQEKKTQEQLLINEMHDNLEQHFPLLDLKRSNSHYGLLAEQLLKEYHRMDETKNVRFKNEEERMISFWFDLAFDDIYDNHNIHWIETKHNAKPKLELLENLMPQIEYICTKAYYHLKIAKSIPKKVRRPIQPAKARKHKPPQKGQSKMSSFFKVKKAKSSSKTDKTSDDNSVEAIAEPVPDRKPWEMEEEEQIYFPYGRYKKALPEKPTRDFFVTWLQELLDEYLPEIQGDQVIQIGTTFKRYGESELYLKHIITLKNCSEFDNYQLIEDENQDIHYDKLKEAQSEAKKLKIANPSSDLANLNQQILTARKEKQHQNDHSVIRIECYDTEREVLLAWQRLIKESDPDIMTGYNIFGFDFDFMWKRAIETNCLERFRDMGRIKHYPERFKEQKLASSGLGENYLKYMIMTGRVLIDLFKVVQTGGYRLPFYKLDFVCQTFLSKRKNDLPPDQIFIHQRGTNEDRATIAKYCLIDCILCNRLMDRLDIITNNIGMSQVCTVPLSYLFLRGQGIKILSLVAKICLQEGYLIRTKERVLKSEKFEGAIVLEPTKDIYFTPSVVADFNSLYPSCMIAENLSHDSFVEIDGPYDNLPDTEYVDIEYDLYEEQEIPGRKTTQKVKVGVKRCRFYQPGEGEKSLLPRILMKLLKARKDTRKEQKKFAKGSFEWSVKEGLQLAYKITANSLYGQVGAKTSPIFLKEIAACTTASGRKLIYFTKDFIIKNYEKSKVIYGDSVTGDTPILLKDPQSEKIEIKIIEDLNQNHSWDPYEIFKAQDLDSNRKEKQQTSTQYEVWTDQGWSPIKRVIRHKCKKKIYRVASNYGIVDVTEDHSLLDENLKIIKPNEISEKTQLLHSFPKKLPNDTFQNKLPKINQENQILSKNKKEALEIFCLLKSRNINFLLNYKLESNHYSFNLSPSSDDNPITNNIFPLTTTEDFVYDLETECGRFHAGVGELIIKNTDSVFASFNCMNSRNEKLHGLDGVNKSIELCVEASLAISRMLKRPHNLEFEKAIFPFMLLSKKRYHGHYYTNYAVAEYFAKSMGIVLKRRDNAQIVKYVFGGILKVIMEEHDIEKAKEVAKVMFKEVLEGNFDLEMFVITKSLRSYYKNPEQIAHNVLAQRIGERDPGNKPQSNDRLPYVYIKIPPLKKGEKILQGNRIETPEFIKENNLEIDYKFYLTNQIMKPVSQIFELVMPDVTELFVDALMDYERKQTGIQRMSKWAMPNSDEFRARVTKELREILEAQEKEDDRDPEVGDEVLEYGNPVDTSEY